MKSVEEYCAARCEGAFTLLPFCVREQAWRMSRADRSAAEEFRLRIGCEPTVLFPDGERPLGSGLLKREDLQQTMEIVTGASVYSSTEQMRGGYVTAKGGYRVGIGGRVFIKDGAVGGFGYISSLSIRISREILGVADKVMGEVARGGFTSTLIVSPPGVGKTTLLRDMARQLSDGSGDRPGVRVGLADERGEVAAMVEGEPQMHVGKQTDILEGCPKDRAVMLLLRNMNPQIIALDEITAPEDARAIETARNCGVELLATAHASGLEDLMERSIYRGLIEEKVFKNYVLIRRERGRRVYEVIGGAGN